MKVSQGTSSRWPRGRVRSVVWALISAGVLMGCSLPNPPEVVKPPPVVDTMPPAAPAGLTATASSAGIVLKWTANTEADLAGYRVLRSPIAGGPFTVLTPTPLTASTYTDTSAQPGQMAYYQVVAVDKKGNASGPASASAIRPLGADVTPPAVPTALTATDSGAGIALNWADSPEPDLAGYRVLRSASAGGPFALLTPTLLSVSAYTDAAAPQGQTSFYQVIAVDGSGNASAPAPVSATRLAASAVRGRVSLESLDGGPFADRMVFSRIGSLSSPPGNGVHDRAVLRVKNSGSGDLQITGLPLTDGWVLESAPALPLTLRAAEVLDLKLRFVAQDVQVHSGTLSVVSNDPTASNKAMQLAGLWQSQSENNAEPSLEQIMQDGFGFKTAFAPGSNVNQQGRVTPQGDEVIAPYWQRADPSQPVAVQQLAAYHTQGDSTALKWFAKGSGTENVVMIHAGADGQTVLPRLSNSPDLARSTFSPAQTFGLKVDFENSDPALNYQDLDVRHGCAAPCGQHVRFFVARDRSNQILPNTYLLIMDYEGINYDYNDNIYLINNLKPASLLINVGTTGQQFTAPDGNVWFSDRDRNGYAPFTPPDAKDEPSGGPNPGLDILNTTNDALYRSYRGNVGALNPRSISFNIPLENGPHTLRLHFADLAHTEAGKRVFDVVAEGRMALPSLDIVKEAGNGKTALVKTVAVTVDGGLLTLTLTASVDYPALAGIEVVR
ncbi:malectin domain-containing carbohydrate-binding protein [Deinococcus arenicola]|uniref:Malectin domain-containing carbohydrate-binding protein n=1 Tax=Deinococcus arenicola TaxID=2994950 RepID=A0ABU4DTY1_9DEIO|nr:malectin domain-containing carbohydrate-binding protein [Deinococcus sp. ZS9-10]MDV6375365.1 malectin domain-containing carbohydrate-binding protein [Deinococcus sp. ZS9-10]